MAEPLKNLLHPGVVTDIADRITRNSSAFDRAQFLELAGDGLEMLELMQRSLKIRDALVETLPQPFPEAAAILSACLPRDCARPHRLGIAPPQPVRRLARS